MVHQAYELWFSLILRGLREARDTLGAPRVAEETIPDVDASGIFPGKVVTKISQAGRFWEAETEDQDYLQRYPESSQLPRRETAA